jgi:hypothetical protein
MHRLAFALVVAGAVGCGVEKDDRPLELEYLTQAIFAPTCGATQCHSTFKQANNVVFDNPESARSTLVNGGLIRYDGAKFDPEEPEEADLIVWITELDPFGAGIGRMPFDAPLPNKDVQLLMEWIRDPATDPDNVGGLGRGAQCDPSNNNGRACRNREIVECGDDWNFGEVIETCPDSCTSAAVCR